MFEETVSYDVMTCSAPTSKIEPARKTTQIMERTRSASKTSFVYVLFRGRLRFVLQHQSLFSCSSLSRTRRWLTMVSSCTCYRRSLELTRPIDWWNVRGPWSICGSLRRKGTTIGQQHNKWTTIIALAEL